jgi:hypothetical protein
MHSGDINNLLKVLEITATARQNRPTEKNNGSGS